jgi:hypothetical protein
MRTRRGVLLHQWCDGGRSLARALHSMRRRREGVDREHHHRWRTVRARAHRGHRGGGAARLLARSGPEAGHAWRAPTGRHECAGGHLFDRDALVERAIDDGPADAPEQPAELPVVMLVDHRVTGSDGADLELLGGYTYWVASELAEALVAEDLALLSRRAMERRGLR